MMLFVRATAAFVCAVIVFMCAGPSFAQGETSSITGLVVQQKNALAISGATVILARAGTRVSSTQTDSSGRFVFSGVAPGPSYWNSNLFVSHSFNHGKTVLTVGGTNVFNNAAQYYGYIGQGTYARLNQFYTNPASPTYAPATTATQEFVNGEYTAERFGLTPAQFTLTLAERM